MRLVPFRECRDKVFDRSAKHTHCWRQFGVLVRAVAVLQYCTLEGISVECALGTSVVSDHPLHCLHAYLSPTVAVREGNLRKAVVNAPGSKEFLSKCSNKLWTAISGQLIRYAIRDKAASQAGDKACGATGSLLDDRPVVIPLQNDKVVCALVMEVVSTY